MSGKWRIALLALVAWAVVVGWGMKTNPSSEYRFPMNGSDFLLSGTFGELRTNHFHSGIDVKTGGEIGKKLYAAREGYVYRLKVSPYGFGKAVYLRHPDGEFTVYAHLNGFSDEIEEYVYQKQYATKRYEQEIYLPEDEIQVQKGQFIAYSGNSGSSMGPHLHFEIRDPEERITNVLQHYKYAIRDKVKPIVQRIGLQALDAGSHVDERYEKVEIVPQGGNGSYTIPGVTPVQGRFGVEYLAYDLLDAAPNHCGINYAQLYLDNQEIFMFEMDEFGFDEKKYINVHFDYPHYKRTGRKFQKAYIDHGNRLPCYPRDVNQGIIELQDDLVHQVRLDLIDTHGNKTNVKFKVQRRKRKALPQELKFPGVTSLSAHRHRSVFVCEIKNPSTAHLRGVDVHYNNGDTQRIRPAYLEGNVLTYLVDLEKWRLPAHIQDPITGKKAEFFYEETVLPDKNNIVETGEIKCYFPYTAVFDSLPLHVRRYPGNSRMYSDIYEIGSQNDPLFKSFVLNIQPNRSGKRQHMVLATQNRSGRWQYLGKELNEDQSVYASSGKFGTFCVMADSTSPVIRPSNISDGGTVSARQSTLRIRITDNFSGIDSQRILGTIDDRWVLFEFDAKTSTITHRLRERPSSGAHTLHLMVYDNANNLAEKSFTLYF